MPVAAPFRRRLVSLLLLAASLVAAGPLHAAIPEGKGSFVFEDARGNADRPIQVWTYRPQGFRPESPIVFVMHGMLRNGETYREPWVPIADHHQCLVIVPEFSTKHYPGSRMYHFGNVRSSDGQPIDEAKWTFSAIEHLFDHVKQEAGSQRNSYYIFGHSAGSQFVHRMVLFKPGLRVAAAVTANAGSYTMPTFETEQPYGLGTSGVSEAQLRKAMALPLIVLLGEKDIDPNDKNLPRDAGARAQGEHRFERGQNFYKAGQAEAKRLQVELRWTLQTVPDVGHDNAKMAPAAAQALFALETAVQQKADLVLLGGKVVTVDPKRPTAEAIAVSGDKILAVGSDKEISALIGDKTRVIRLQGRLAIPGFIEGHGHFLGLGQSKMMLDLRHAKSWEEIVKQVEAAVRKAPPGSWIVGRGWHQEKWEKKPEPNVNGYPVHAALSRVSPKNPVLLTHASGHACFANAEAMRLAGVDASTKPPRGGEIPRDKDGNHAGVFRETAQGLITRVHSLAERDRTPEQRSKDMLKALELAAEECLQKGVTSFQDAGSSFALIDVFKKLASEGKLPVRLWVMVRDDNASLAKRLTDYRTIGAGNNHLTVRGIKRSIDGALGPHGAWLLEPYDDMPASTGLNITSVESIRETARLALTHDYQLCVHAIGDRANRETLNLFEEVFKANPSKESRRWRIEHAQHLHPDDIPRFGKLGVIASMQGNHCTSDGPYVIPRLGLRRAEQGAYVWRSLLDTGAIVTNGTDVPVEDVDPIESFYASVTRKLPSGAAFFRNQCMTREEALRSYTRDCAYAAFEETLKGTLSPGKLADIVVLSGDIMSCPEDEIRKAKVVYTIVGGKVLYGEEKVR
jgi:predicted amidohydrolase YtcJ/poly(3-hydroxybutyrate) depolymerase